MARNNESPYAEISITGWSTRIQLERNPGGTTLHLESKDRKVQNEIADEGWLGCVNPAWL